MYTLIWVMLIMVAMQMIDNAPVGSLREKQDHLLNRDDDSSITTSSYDSHNHPDHYHRHDNEWNLHFDRRRRLVEHHNYTDPIILNTTDTDHFVVTIVYFAYINTKRENWLKLIMSQVCACIG